MTLHEAITLVRAHVERQFPKTCSKCGRVFGSLPDYLRGTRHVGQPVSYDAELGDWTPTEPAGTFAFALCSCGTSLSITSTGMGLAAQWRLLRFTRSEARRRGIAIPTLLATIRDEVDRQALAHERARAAPAPRDE